MRGKRTPAWFWFWTLVVVVIGIGLLLVVAPAPMFDDRPSVLGLPAGLSQPAGEPFALAHSEEPVDGLHGLCSLGWTVRGRLVIENPNGGTAIVVEGFNYGNGTVGATSPVWWWPNFTGRRVGNEVEIVDPDGKVVATTGQRYEIYLAFPPGGPPYVVCGGEATPL